MLAVLNEPQEKSSLDARLCAERWRLELATEPHQRPSHNHRNGVYVRSDMSTSSEPVWAGGLPRTAL